MAKFSRRQWLKGGLVVGGLALFGASYREVAKRAVDGLVDGTSGKVTLNRINGNSLIPEGTAIGGWKENPEQVVSMTQCFGCWTQCGIRARVDSAKMKCCASPVTLIIHYPTKNISLMVCRYRQHLPKWGRKWLRASFDSVCPWCNVNGRANQPITYSRTNEACR